MLICDGLSAHWSRAMRASVAEQDWLTLERSLAYAPELQTGGPRRSRPPRSTTADVRSRLGEGTG